MAEQQEALDTFEDGEYTTGSYDDVEDFDEVEASGDQEDAGEEEGTQGQDSEEVESFGDEGQKIDPDSQLNNLEENEADSGEESKESEEKEDDKSDEGDKESDEEEKSDDESKDDAGEDAGKLAEDVRTIKAFTPDGKRLEVPENAEVKVKIAGKSEKVTVAELRDAYSGKVAYEEKFENLATDKKTFESERDAYQAEIQEVTNFFGEVSSLVKQGMEGEVDPLAAFNFLLDGMGVNSVKYGKAMREHLASEHEIYNEMTDAERDAYWYKKENDYLVNKQESARKRSESLQAQEEQNSKISQLREAHGISEDDYSSANEALKEMGRSPEEITPELIVQTAVLSPLMDTGESLVEPYLDQLTDDEADEYIKSIAVAMYENPEQITEDYVRTMLAEEFEVEDITSQLSEKVKPAEKAPGSGTKTKKSSVYEYESFDDYDY